jgi:hypothetical protein
VVTCDNRSFGGGWGLTQLSTNNGAVEVVRVRAVRMQLWYAVVMRVQLWRG